MKPSLGKFTDDGAAALNLESLLETRLLIQSNSGGGKSWAVRRLLEQTAGDVQQLVIDPEGEFATLREQFDFVIAAPHDGDALAHPKTAKVLAHRLLETGVSAILDIYDLKAHERQAFVRIFLEAVVNAPKALWRPALIVLDEAHVFAPEHGKAESAGAVIDLATRGRKRGFCLVAATQRLAKLHKDVAAELLNKLIGRTGLDVDVKRAADELGMTAREAMETLRPLAPGQFFAFGPALSTTVRQIDIGPVKTTHPKIGDRTLRAPPKPTAAIKAVLPKLADLQKEAETEARTIDDLRRELAAARRELTHAKNSSAIGKIKAPSREDLKAAEQCGYERGRIEGARAVEKQAQAHLKALRGALHKGIDQVCGHDGALVPPAFGLAVIKRSETPPKPVAEVARHGSNGSGELSAAARKILGVLSQFPEGCQAGKLTLLTGYRYSGSFQNALSELRTAGLIDGANTGVMRITTEGLARGPFPELPHGSELTRYWLTHPSFSKAARLILEKLVEGGEMTAEQLCSATGYNYSGSFQNALSELRTAGVLIGRNNATMRASPEIL